MQIHGLFKLISFISFVGINRSPPKTEENQMVPWNPLERGSIVPSSLIYEHLKMSINLSKLVRLSKLGYWPQIGYNWKFLNNSLTRA